jgi:hypothetical protein
MLFGWPAVLQRAALLQHSHAVMVSPPAACPQRSLLRYVQGYSGGDSSGSEDEDMDSEDEEIDIGEVKHLWSLLDAPSVHANLHAV